jgi:thiamine biosynthesis protein ThiI
VLERAVRVPGVHSGSIAWEVAPELEAIQAIAARIVAEQLAQRGREATTRFKVATRRADKRLPLRSMEVSRAVGAFLGARFPQLVVDLDHPEITIGIDLRGADNFVFGGTLAGVGGLPVGTSGRAICLLSGGIDSPVAAFACMRRGVEVHHVSFHSHPYIGEQSRDKIRDLVRVLANYQKRVRLYSLPFAAIQEAVRDVAPESYRTVIYRRAMQRLADRVARSEKALALITGENIGQVASQTLHNIGVISEVAEHPVLRPLLGHDKHEIIDRARRIGTYAISVRPEPDCCTVFQPQRPILEARAELCREVEARIELEELAERAWRGRAVERYERGADPA